MTHEWKEEYYDSDIMDGMQWDIHFWQLNKTYAGSNNFPQNYKEVMDYVKESFNVRLDVESIKNDFPTVEYDFSTIEEYITKQLEEIGKMEEPNHEEKTKR